MRRAAATLVGVGVLAVGAGTVDATTIGAQTGVIVTPVSDGTAPFDPTDDTGLDTGPANGRVRTLDTVTYRVDYQFNHAADRTKLVTYRTTGGWFAVTPPRCGDPVISADRTEMTCTVGASPDAGTVGTVEVAVSVGAIRDGSEVTFSAVASSDGAAAVSTAAPVIATAAPRWNAAASQGGGSYLSTARRGFDENGVDGYHLLLPVSVEADVDVNGGKGTEGLTGDLEFSVTVATPSSTPPTFRLAGGPLEILDLEVAPCGPDLLGANWNLPFGDPTASPIATTENSASIGGSWSCTQATPGGPIDVRVTGALLSPSGFPSVSAMSVPLFPRRILVAANLVVFVSTTDVQAAMGPGNGILNYSWNVSGFDPTGLSATSNHGSGTEPLGDNTGYGAIVHQERGEFDAYYMSDYAEMRANHPAYGPGTYVDPRPRSLDSTRSPYVGSQSQFPHAGDGTVSAGQTFTYALFDAMPLETVDERRHHVVMCAFIDTATTTMIDAPDVVVSEIDSTPGPRYGMTASRSTRPAGGPVTAWSTTRFLDAYGPSVPLEQAVPISVEYGTGPRPSDKSCGDDDSTTPWTTDPRATAGASGGAYPAVTMVRVRTLEPMSSGRGVFAWVSLRAKDGIAPGTWTTTESGQGTWDADTSWSGDADHWASLPYDPDDHGSAYTWGDRLATTERTLVVSKDVAEGDEGELLPGDIATFEVTGTMFGSTSPWVSLVDELPVGLEFVDADVAPEVDGRTLRWRFGATTRGTTYRVRYRARVTADSPNGATLVNTVRGNTPGLAQAGNTLEASASVRTAPGFVQLDVWKSTDRDVVEIGDPYGFTVASRNSANTTLTGLRWIDVLPWSGDRRRPATRFDGTTRLLSATPAAGESIEYTVAPPAGIAVDPDDPSNAPGGATTWCDATAFGTPGCPTTIGDTTAIRITRATLEAGEEMSVALRFQPTGNRAGNRYTNNVAGRDDQTPLVARSEDVTVTVTAATLRVQLSCAATGRPRGGVEARLIDPISSKVVVSGQTATDGTLTWVDLHSGAYTLELDPRPDGEYAVVRAVTLGTEPMTPLIVDGCEPTGPRIAQRSGTTTTSVPTVDTGSTERAGTPGTAPGGASAGAVDQPSVRGGSGAPSSLAFTGGTAGSIGLVAGGLVLLGSAVLAGRRRRRH